MNYERNYLYINKEQQNRIKNTKILIAGIGLGSAIAETALRLGFENLTIIDGDKVEQSNLNRQNYTENDTGYYKTEALRKRLLAINPDAKVRAYGEFLSSNSIEAYLNNIDIAINTLDFDTEAPFYFDKKCNERNIPIIHPYNLGWAATAFVVTPDGKQIAGLHKANEKTELSVVKFILNNLPENAPNVDWLWQIADNYQNNDMKSPPQLAVASQLVAALTTSLMFKITNHIEIKTFPFSYFLSAWS